MNKLHTTKREIGAAPQSTPWFRSFCFVFQVTLADDLAVLSFDFRVEPGAAVTRGAKMIETRK